MSENMTPEEKELVSLMEASGETPDALLYRLRFAPPEQLDTLYNGTPQAQKPTITDKTTGRPRVRDPHRRQRRRDGMDLRRARASIHETP